MKQRIAILLLALLTVSCLPSYSQVRLICRITGVEMAPVSVKDDPHSCCATRGSSSGGVELANRSCCDLRVTPGHPPLPTADLPVALSIPANLPTLTHPVPVPMLAELAPVVAPRELPRLRGPPLLSSISPRGPPSCS
ncbi:MAG: hypothetical protein QM758_15195 [Armatimonas sp.]